MAPPIRKGSSAGQVDHPNQKTAVIAPNTSKPRAKEAGVIERTAVPNLFQASRASCSPDETLRIAESVCSISSIFLQGIFAKKDHDYSGKRDYIKECRGLKVGRADFPVRSERKPALEN